MRPRHAIAPDSSREPVPFVDRTILVVGVDEETRTGFVDMFESQGFRTVQATGVESAEERLLSGAVDLIVFDERLSGGRAYGFCRRMAVEGGAPVILISENADDISRIVALEVGADDLLPTHVDNRLLLAQSRALMRRCDARSERGAPDPTPNEWALDPVSREAIGPDGRRLRISPQEVSLLSMFFNNPGVVFTTETAANWIPTFKQDTSTGFRTAMSRLRRKLDELNAGEVIRTVHGAGYMYYPAFMH